MVKGDMKLLKKKPAKEEQGSMVQFAASHFLSNKLPIGQIPEVQIVLIPLEQLKQRDVNEFAMTGTESLEESIRNFGLIHPIAVIEESEGQFYVSSGNRRLIAYRNIHKYYSDKSEENPSDLELKEKVREFSSIPACVYKIGTQEEKDTFGGNIITKEDEESIYKDANLLSRQIDYKDALRHIDYLVEKLENDEVLEEKALKVVNNKRKEDNAKAYTVKSVPKAQFISDILTNELKFDGFGRVTVSRYLTLREEHPEMLDDVYSGKLSIKKAYELTRPKKQKKVKKQDKLVKQWDGCISQISKVSSEDSESKEVIMKKLNALQRVLADIGIDIIFEESDK